MMVRVSSRFKSLLAVGIACACVAPLAAAQALSANETAYHTLLQQIADKKISIAQQEVFLAKQRDEIEFYQTQLEGLDGVTASIEPMISKMVAGIETEILDDFPFEKDSRMFRLQRLKDLEKDPNASVGEKYRRALEVYKIEVNYGQSLESIQGNHPTDPQATKLQGDDQYKRDEDGEIEVNKKTGQKVLIYDGNYLRYGRVAYVYLNEDGTDPLRYDRETKAWVSLKGKAQDIRMAIRVARGEVPPGVVTAPVLPMP